MGKNTSETSMLITISSNFEGFEPLQNQNFEPPIDFDRVLNTLFFYLVTGQKYGTFR